MVLHLTDKIMNFILVIYKNGYIKRSLQSYDPVRYYTMIYYLRSNGLIYHDGNDERNQKVWKLTDKGLKVAKIIKELKEILDEGKSTNT